MPATIYAAMKPLFFLAALLTAAVPAASAPGTPVAGDHSQLRLLAAGKDADGTLAAGIEINLAPGWKTYWRSPGEAGLAPVFDFSASQNVAGTEVSFPAPTRVDDGFVASNIHTGRLVLPVRVTLADPAKPARLVLSAEIGVCEKICIPVQFAAEIEVDPDSHDADARRAIERARLTLPGAAMPGRFAVTEVARAGGSEKSAAFTARAIVPDPASAELFVEGPEGWYAGVPSPSAGGGSELTFQFSVERSSSAAPIAGAELRLTMKSGGRAIEQRMVLDKNGGAVATAGKGSQ